MNRKPANACHILLAEDNEHDIISIQRAFEKNKIVNPLHIVRNGVECLDYLFRRGQYEDPHTSPTPTLVLLDIKMPKMDGITVLRNIRESKEISRMPVIMLTTSKDQNDITESYDLGVNAYIVKPVELENLAEAIKRIELFWQIVEKPPLNI
ncbi:MAG: response regulator [Spirochaetia bacterium]|nr:response regulator [Spirochaetia bacterium]